MEFKCKKHKTNKGWYDAYNQWHCWKCTYENLYDFPRGKIIDRAIRGDYELRILNTGKEKELILELWNIKTKKLEHRSIHNYLSTIRREFNTLLEEIEDKITRDTSRITLEQSINSTLSTTNSAGLSWSRNTNPQFTTIYHLVTFVKIYIEHDFTNTTLPEEELVGTIYFVDCYFSEDTYTEIINLANRVKFLDCLVLEEDLEENSIPNSVFSNVERLVIEEKRLQANGRPSLFYAYFREGDIA